MPPIRRPLHGHLHKLHGVRLKLNRAQEHADSLRSDISAWFARHPYEVYGVYEPGPPEEYVFRVRFMEPVPPEWAITLGDFAHNARSALDHLAYVVVLENNGGEDERTQFPIVVKASKYAHAERSGIKNASERHRKIIESFQPYHYPASHGSTDEVLAVEDPFALLQTLSNIDKHRVLHATPAAVEAFGWDLEPINDVASIGNSHVPETFLHDDGVLVRAEIVSSGPEPDIRLRRQAERIGIKVQVRSDFDGELYILHSVNLLSTTDAILARLRELYQVFVDELK